MTAYRSPSRERATTRVSSFQAPAFPSNSASRDRRADASAHITKMRDAGFREGYEHGVETGRAAAADEHERTMATARAASLRHASAAESLLVAIEQLRDRDRATMRELEEESIALAVELAEVLIGREVANCEAPVLDALRRAAELVPDRGAPVVRVHPDDQPTVREATIGDTGRWMSEVEVVADASIEPGGCIVDVGPCRIDAQISSAIERMRGALHSPQH